MDNVLTTPISESGESALNPQLTPAVNKRLIDATVEKHKLDTQDKKEERGLLGRLWGSIEHSSNNIAGLFIVLLLFIGFAYTFWMLYIDACDTHSKILDFWGMLSPMLTLALGYLFGRGQANSDCRPSF